MAGVEAATGNDRPQGSLSDSWRVINGRNDWAGSLDPMDPLLRTELIRYGEMAQACYDAFDNESYSKYCGSCKYDRSNFFKCLGMGESGYEVTRYLYATINLQLPNFFTKPLGADDWNANANWMGYVAVSTDETSKRIGRRDITVAWRGTATQLEWLANLTDFLVPASSEGIPCPNPDVKVESGFINLYCDKVQGGSLCTYSARERILTEVATLVDRYKDEEISITFTGHSLGGALALLSAFDVAEMGLNVTTDGRPIPICVFSFSAPRVGNSRFKERVEGLGVKVLRVVNVHDLVPKVPGLLLNKSVPEILRKLGQWLPYWSYSHVGVELPLDHKNSPFLKSTLDLSCFHNLEAHLHLLDGYHGKGQCFFLSSGRDPALVNKASDFLKDENHVPPRWRQEENKGLVMKHDGRWIQLERPMFDEHLPEIYHHRLEQISRNSPVH
ncbi:phospholipase A1-Igamma1, chloroplastic-like [Aristolochia californica]|uniref:phospholipase A1-Igamma1, chloroplastic-like n=1 Tax=Aristolochia californica TaxID=171875 RepID=UPI0035D6A0B1